jgi:carbonic anhydrase
MSGSVIPCSTSTAPIDIDTSTPLKLPQCTLKCEYKFNYKDSYCIAKNEGGYITLSYDAVSSENVIYNLTKYTVKEIRIYKKSLHKFNGSATDGEMIIVHTASGKLDLLVCVPIVIGTSTNVATEKLKTIFENISINANRIGQTSTITDLKYNLNSFIPKKPFYMYTATEPWTPCYAKMCYYIVFNPSSETNIYIPLEYYNNKFTVFNAHAYTVKPITPLKNFVSFNPNGPLDINSDEIYIDCQPVGASDELKTVVTNTGSGLTTNVTAASVFNNIFIQIVVGSIIFVLFIWIVSKFLDIAKVKRVSTMLGGGSGTGIGSWFYTTGAAS